MAAEIMLKEADMSILSWLIVGLIAGWIAGVIMKGGGYGLIGNIVVAAILGRFVLGPGLQDLVTRPVIFQGLDQLRHRASRLVEDQVLGELPAVAAGQLATIKLPWVDPLRQQFVGGAQTGPGNYHAFMFDGGRMIDLGTMGGSNSWAYGINDNGWMVGASGMAGTNMHAFVCTNALTNASMMDYCL